MACIAVDSCDCDVALWLPILHFIHASKKYFMVLIVARTLAYDENDPSISFCNELLPWLEMCHRIKQLHHHLLGDKKDRLSKKKKRIIFTLLPFSAHIIQAIFWLNQDKMRKGRNRVYVYVLNDERTVYVHNKIYCVQPELHSTHKCEQAIFKTIQLQHKSHWYDPKTAYSTEKGERTWMRNSMLFASSINTWVDIEMIQSEFWTLFVFNWVIAI